MSAEITNKISALGDKYGSELLALMDYYNVDNLHSISQEQAERYYSMRMFCIGLKCKFCKER